MLNRILVAIMCLCAGFAIGIGMYEGCKKTPKSAVITEIKRLRDTVYAYKPSKYRDTITQITVRYRVRVDSIREWLQANNDWESICKEIAPQEDSLGCQRVLVQAYYKSQYQDTLIGIYQAQRSEDSLEIGYLMKLDSLNSVVIKSLQTGQKVSQAHSRADRLKQAGKITLSAIVGFIVGRL